MLRLLLLVLALAFLAYCQSPPYAFTVSVSATFSDVEAPRSTRRMKFCYAPDIPCVEEQDIECECPENLPSTGPMSLDPVVGFPQQFRWGTETESNMQIPLPSGFGFRGTKDQPVATYESEFYVGRVAHFNNPITGDIPDRWTMNLIVSVTPYGQETKTATFSYELELDETLNDCEGGTKTSGCPWESASYFSKTSPRPLQDPTCQRVGYSSEGGGSLNELSNGKTCCPYDTLPPNPPEPDQLNSGACADRIRHLNPFEFQSQSFDINGIRYTMFLSGFRPDGSTETRDFFISQERGQTEMQLYGRLVRSCPSSCPGGAQPQLNPEGTACVCPCTNSCPPPQIRQDDCSCQCPPSIDCGAGEVSTTDCSCICTDVNCPSGYAPNPDKRCECECQSCTVDMSQYGDDAPCLTTQCPQSGTQCHVIPLPDGRACTKTDPNLDDECYTSTCIGGVCTIVPVEDGKPCTPSATNPDLDPQCHKTMCKAGVCEYVSQENKHCNDGNPCTSWPGAIDPITGAPTDLCVMDPAQGEVVCQGQVSPCSERPCFSAQCVLVGGAGVCVYEPLPYGTVCNDGLVCTVNDICQEEAFLNETSGQIEKRPTGECRGQVLVCPEPENDCLVQRCIESEGGCVVLSNVKDGVECELDNDTCTVDRCYNGTCVATDEPSPCPADGGANTAAIIGGTVGAVAGLLAIAGVIAIAAVRHAAATKVFDQTTWEVAGASSNQSPLYVARNTEMFNAIYDRPV